MHYRRTRYLGIAALLLAGQLQTGPSAYAQQGQLPPTDAMAWVMGTKLGIAAVATEAGADKDTVGNMVQSATVIAEALGTEAPAIPERGTLKKSEFGARILGYLLKDTKPVGEYLATQHGQRAADLFEIATKSSILAMMYAPQDETGLSIADVVEERAQRANLESSLWEPLVRDIRAGASYDKVKKRLFEMHEAVRVTLMAE